MTHEGAAGIDEDSRGSGDGGDAGAGARRRKRGGGDAAPAAQAGGTASEGPPDGSSAAPPDPSSDAVPADSLDAEGAEGAPGVASPSATPAASAAPDAGDAAADEDGAPRRRGRSEERPPPPPLERVEGAVEAILLASGEALSAERIRDLLGLPSAVHVKESVEKIRARWAEARLPVEIQDVAGGHRVVTRPEHAEYVRRLWRRPAADRLSATLLETLSIVAYKQPVARAEIERIRGVQCGEALRQLLERRLLKVSGRSDQPGRPLLYATTTRFLEVFGLAGLEDLPNAKDLARL